jgi:hypothetical protein
MIRSGYIACSRFYDLLGFMTCPGFHDLPWVSTQGTDNTNHYTPNFKIIKLTHINRRQL